MQSIHTTQQQKHTIMSFLNNLLSKFSGTQAAPAPVAVSTVVQADNSAEVRFGFTSAGTFVYDPNQTYSDFAAGQAKIAGINLQENYTAQFIVNGSTFVINPSMTFEQLNKQYSVTPSTPVTVAIPDPERPAGRLG